MSNIERLKVSLYNRSGVDMLASATFNSNENIVEKASDYRVRVEFARIDLANLVIDQSPDYSIMILNDEGGKPGNRFPNLPEYVNYFNYPQAIRDVHELSDWFYSLFHKVALPETLGTLSITPNGYFRYTLTQGEYDSSFGNGLFKVYVNESLRRLIPELVSRTDPESISGKTWWRLKPEVGDNTQVADTLYQMLKADSVSYYTSLPVNPTRCQNDRVGVLTKENILCTMSINNETTNIIEKSSKRYEPVLVREYSMVNDQPITNFTISALVTYIDGSSTMHTLRPGDYMGFLVGFFPVQ